MRDDNREQLANFKSEFSGFVGEVSGLLQHIEFLYDKGETLRAHSLFSKLREIDTAKLVKSEATTETQFLLSKAIDELENQNPQTAFEFSIQAKKLGAKVRGVDYVRALVFVELNRVADARESLREELRHFSENEPAKELLDHILQHEKDTFDRLSGLDPEFVSLYKPISEFTMLPLNRLYSLYVLARTVCEEDVEGDFVECGVAGGGSSAMLAAVIKKFSKSNRTLYSCDTFSGMPTPGETDRAQGLSADSTGWGEGTCAAPIESLRAACKILGVESMVNPVQGLFSNTLPIMAPSLRNIAFLHADCDWYSSTMDVLHNLYFKLNKGAFVQLDDFGYWEGVEKALFDFCSRNKIAVEPTLVPEGGAAFFKV